VRSLARQRSDAERDIDLEHAAVTTGGVLTWPSAGPFRDGKRASSLADDIATNNFHIERVVTAGDGAVTDSFVNNAG
jgi:hypothetical protein